MATARALLSLAAEVSAEADCLLHLAEQFKGEPLTRSGPEALQVAMVKSVAALMQCARRAAVLGGATDADIWPSSPEMALEPTIADLEAALEAGDCNYLAENTMTLVHVIGVLQRKYVNLAGLYHRAVSVWELHESSATDRYRPEDGPEDGPEDAPENP